MSLSNVSGALSGAQSFGNTITSGANTVGALASALGLGGSGAKPKYWKDKLQKASFRGVPFCFLEGEAEFGRQVAVHKYPYRDGVWPEDLNRLGRGWRLQAFLVGDDCIAQRASMIQAVETKGPGDLVHPTFGRKKVSVLNFTVSEAWDRGRVFVLHFTVVEWSPRQFPTVATSTTNAVSSAASTAKTATSASALSNIGNAIQSGISAVKSAISTVQAVTLTAQKIVNDATNLVNFVQSLPGAFGRFVNSVTGTGSITATTAPTTTQANPTADSLIAQGTVARNAVTTAASALTAAAQGLQLASSTPQVGIGGNIIVTTPSAGAAAMQTYATALQALIASVSAAASTPGDAIRMLANLIASAPSLPTNLTAPTYPLPATSILPAAAAAAVVAGSTADLYRRTAVIEMALASSQYQPTSFDDAVAMLDQVTGAIDAEVEIAGDQGDDATYQSLRALRGSVVQDLVSRGASLAPMVEFKFGAVMPALALAQRLYQDSTRSDQLVAAANPQHPAFMPVNFKALAQ